MNYHSLTKPRSCGKPQWSQSNFRRSAQVTLVLYLNERQYFVMGRDSHDTLPRRTPMANSLNIPFSGFLGEFLGFIGDFYDQFWYYYSCILHFLLFCRCIASVISSVIFLFRSLDQDMAFQIQVLFPPPSQLLTTELDEERRRNKVDFSAIDMQLKSEYEKRWD